MQSEICRCEAVRYVDVNLLDVCEDLDDGLC